MLYITIFTVFLLALILKIFVKDRIALILIGIYVGWYGFWLCLSTFNLYGLYDVSDRAYFYQLLGLIMLTLGFLVPGNVVRRSNVDIEYEHIDLQFEKSVWFRIILLLSLVYIAFVTIAYYKLTIVESDVRTVFFEDYGRELIFGNRYLGLLWNWIGIPFYYFIMFLFCIRFINKKIVDFWSFLYVLSIGLFGYIGSGRGSYVYLLQMLIILGIINNITRCISNTSQTHAVNFKKLLHSLWMIVLFLMIILALGYITSIRQGKTEFNLANAFDGLDTFGTQIVIYNNGPFRAFDYAINNNYIDKIGQLYGRGTLASIDEFIFILFAMFGVIAYVPANELIGSVLQYNLIPIGDLIMFNYAYTQSMIFYLDFGVAGIVVISLLFGCAFRKAISYFINNSNAFSLFLVSFLTLALLSSVFAYKLQLMNSFIIIMGALFFSEKYKSSH